RTCRAPRDTRGPGSPRARAPRPLPIPRPEPAARSPSPGWRSRARGGAGSRPPRDDDPGVAERRTLDRGEGPYRLASGADEALELVRPAPRAPPLALDAFGRAAREHGVLGRDPASPLAAEKRWDGLLDGRRADDPGRAHLDEHRALGGGQEARHERHRPEL